MELKKLRKGLFVGGVAVMIGGNVAPLVTPMPQAVFASETRAYDLKSDVLAYNKRAEAQNKQIKVRNDAAKKRYDEALKQYNIDLANFNEATATYQEKKQHDSELTEKYKTEKAAYDRAYADYTKARDAYVKDVIEKAARNAEKKRAYDQALSRFQADQATYNAALESYNQALSDNDALKARNEVKEKAYADALEKFDVEASEYNTAIESREKIIKENADRQTRNDVKQAAFEQSQVEYNQAKQDYDAEVSARDAVVEQNGKKNRDYNDKLADYKQAKLIYDKYKGNYNKKKEAYDNAVKKHQDWANQYANWQSKIHEKIFGVNGTDMRLDTSYLGVMTTVGHQFNQPDYNLLPTNETFMKLRAQDIDGAGTDLSQKMLQTAAATVEYGNSLKKFAIDQGLDSNPEHGTYANDNDRYDAWYIAEGLNESLLRSFVKSDYLFGDSFGRKIVLSFDYDGLTDDQIAAIPNLQVVSQNTALNALADYRAKFGDTLKIDATHTLSKDQVDKIVAAIKQSSAQIEQDMRDGWDKYRAGYVGLAEDAKQGTDYAKANLEKRIGELDAAGNQIIKAYNSAAGLGQSVDAAGALVDKPTGIYSAKYDGDDDGLPDIVADLAQGTDFVSNKYTNANLLTVLETALGYSYAKALNPQGGNAYSGVSSLQASSRRKISQLQIEFAAPVEPSVPKDPGEFTLEEPKKPEMPTLEIVPVVGEEPQAPFTPDFETLVEVPAEPVAPRAPQRPILEIVPGAPQMPIAPQAPTVPEYEKFGQAPKAPVAPVKPTLENPTAPQAPTKPVLKLEKYIALKAVPQETAPQETVQSTKTSGTAEKTPSHVLPQTGNRTNKVLPMFGLAMLALTGLVTLKKKRA